MELLPSAPRRHHGRTTALVAALSLIVTPLLVAPSASATTDPTSSSTVAAQSTDEPAPVVTDVVAPQVDQLAIDGTLQVGEDVVVDPRAQLWSPADLELSFTYRWYADDAVVADGAGPALTLAPQTAGTRISVEITGTAPEGAVDGETSASVVVTSSGRVAPGVFVAPDPTIDGDAQVGRTLAAVTGAWEPAAALGYRWLRDGEEIKGATSANYTPTADDLGKALTVEVTGTAQGYEARTLTSQPTPAVLVADLAASRPTLSGAVRVGSKVTATPGAWTAGTALSYQWYVSDKAISGATKPAYTPTSSDKGKKLAVGVTGTKPGYTTATTTSVGTTVAAGVLSAPTPKLSGTVRVGSKVTAKPGTWASGTTLSYQWYASGTKIAGARKSTYTPTASVKGKALTVKVTGKKTGYTTATKASAGTKVAAGSFTSAPKPKIKGTVRVGSTVSVTRGAWSPSATTYRYQWKVGGTSIKGATGSRYKIPAKYAGKKLTVSVTAVRSGYTSRTVTSASGKVLRVFSKTSAPKVTGSVRVGSTVKVSSKGTWSPAPKSWKYQWKANGTAIKGATKSSFKLTSAQHGKKITVTVSGVRSGYSTKSRTSSATAKVAWPVGVSKPKVTTSPKQQWVTSGQTATFSVKASGGRLKYQWQISTDGKKWTSLAGKTSSTLKLSTRSSRDGSLVRVVVKNVAGKVTSKSARLFVDSKRSDPYSANFVFTTWNWAEVIGSTRSMWWTNSTDLVYAPMSVCYYGDGSAEPWLDLDVEYVSKNGVVYDDDYEFFDDDIWGTSGLYYGGCTYFTAYAVVPAGAVKGGTWRVTDWSEYPSYAQWVKGA